MSITQISVKFHTRTRSLECQPVIFQFTETELRRIFQVKLKETEMIFKAEMIFSQKNETEINSETEVINKDPYNGGIF